MAAPAAGSPDKIVDRLRAAGCVFAEEEAALLREAAATPAELERLLVARVTGVPLEQLLGWADFCGLRIAVEPGVFVPRQRSALMVCEAARLLVPGDVVVDLCCGSGAVGAAVLTAVPGVELHAADIAPAAVRCARRNLPTAQVHQGDLFDALPRRLRGRVKVITCNAPYVPSAAVASLPPEARDHEPRASLDGGPDGLAVVARVLGQATPWLAASGSLLVEVAEHQVAAAVARAAGAGLWPRVVRREETASIVLAASPAGRHVSGRSSRV
jgi:release factor glutamine methyltransferase